MITIHIITPERHRSAPSPIDDHPADGTHLAFEFTGCPVQPHGRRSSGSDIRCRLRERDVEHVGVFRAVRSITTPTSSPSVRTFEQPAKPPSTAHHETEHAPARECLPQQTRNSVSHRRAAVRPRPPRRTHRDRSPSRTSSPVRRPHQPHQPQQPASSPTASGAIQIASTCPSVIVPREAFTANAALAVLVATRWAARPRWSRGCGSRGSDEVGGGVEPEQLVPCSLFWILRHDRHDVANARSTVLVGGLRPPSIGDGGGERRTSEVGRQPGQGERCEVGRSSPRTRWPRNGRIVCFLGDETLDPSRVHVLCTRYRRGVPRPR